MSVRLSSCADERRIVYSLTLHMLNTEDLRGTEFVRRMLTAAQLCAVQCSMFEVLCLVSTRRPFDFVGKCLLRAHSMSVLFIHGFIKLRGRLFVPRSFVLAERSPCVSNPVFL